MCDECIIRDEIMNQSLNCTVQKVKIGKKNRRLEGSRRRSLQPGRRVRENVINLRLLNLVLTIINFVIINCMLIMFLLQLAKY